MILLSSPSMVSPSPFLSFFSCFLLIRAFWRVGFEGVAHTCVAVYSGLLPDRKSKKRCVFHRFQPWDWFYLSMNAFSAKHVIVVEVG
jgi:hypothetical protein